MFLVQLLVAGNETTRNMMSGGLVGFAEAPGQWEALRAGADRVPRALPLAVEEMLRWTTPVVAFMRTTTRTVGWAAGQLGAGRAGAHALRLGQPGRDGLRSRRPTAFDAARDPNPHVAFGFGAHFCIGAVLARLEGRILLEELLARFGSIESAGPVVRTASPVIAGVKSAPLVFGAA